MHRRSRTLMRDELFYVADGGAARDIYVNGFIPYNNNNNDGGEK